MTKVRSNVVFPINNRCRVIAINGTCVWWGYELTFKFNDSVWTAHTKGGNRGKMTLYIDTLDTCSKTINVRYMHNNHPFVIHYKSIDREA